MNKPDWRVSSVFEIDYSSIVEQVLAKAKTSFSPFGFEVISLVNEKALNLNADLTKFGLNVIFRESKVPGGTPWAVRFTGGGSGLYLHSGHVLNDFKASDQLHGAQQTSFGSIKNMVIEMEKLWSDLLNAGNYKEVPEPFVKVFNRKLGDAIDAGIMDSFAEFSRTKR